MFKRTETRVSEIVPLQELLLASGKPTLEKKILRRLVEFAERRLGGPLLFSPPSPLLEFGIENDEALRIIKRFKDQEFLAAGPWRLSCAPDEPRIMRITLGEDSGGAHLSDTGKALWGALGEFTERKLWRTSSEWYEKSIVYGSWNDFSSRAIDPRLISGIPPEARSNNRMLRITEDTRFGWIPAHSLTSSETKLTPVQLYSLRYWNDTHSGNQPKEPMLREPITTGLATGQSMSEATLRGALEVIERDAFMITYLNRISPPRLDLQVLSQDPSFSRILEQCKRYRLEPVLLSLPTDFSPIRVVAAALIDRTGVGPALTMGAKADFSMRTAALGALTESIAVRHGYRGVEALPDDFPVAKIRQKERIRYWFKPERLPSIEFLLTGPIETPRLPTLEPDRTHEREFEFHCKERVVELGELLKKNNCTMYWVDMTTSVVRESSGMRVAFAASPELQPLYLNEHLPEIGGDRLRTVPEKLGYKNAEAFNTIPHPFP